MNFVAANIGYTRSPLAPAMARMLTVRKSAGSPALDIALGWHIFTTGGHDIIWHNGGTGGYRTFIGFDPKARVGVVVLSNTSTTVGVDDIGRHLLDSAVPLVPANSHCCNRRRDSRMNHSSFGSAARLGMQIDRFGIGI